MDSYTSLHVDASITNGNLYLSRCFSILLIQTGLVLYASIYLTTIGASCSVDKFPES